MAMRKFGNAVVTAPIVDPFKWVDKKVPASRLKVAKKVISSYDPSKWLLSHCFPSGNLVLMGDGTEKTIEQIVVGDLVVTHSGNIKEVTNVMSRDVDENILVISPASLPDITCTKEHPFYTIKREDSWCKVFPNFKIKEKVKCTFGGKSLCNKYNCLTNGAYPSWETASNLKVGDRLYTPSLHEVVIVNDLNPNRMRLLGYYTAEGRVDKQKGPNSRPYMIRFSIHDKELYTLGDEIARLMKLEFNINNFSILKCKASGQGLTMSFHSFNTALWFLKHAGIGSKSKKLSADVMLSPISWQKQLMGSWLNGDGSYDHHIYNPSVRLDGSRGIRLSTVSKDLVSQAVLILDRIGIHSTVQKVSNVGCKPRYIRGKCISDSSGWHVAISKAYVEKLLDVVQWKVSGNLTNLISTKGRYRYAASTISIIESISEKRYTGKVYNFSVKDDESYVINRCAVHNCTIMASVDVEQADPKDKKSNYLIIPEYSMFVNNNGDSWERELLRKASKTFLGADNYVEHIQIESLSKGKVIDMALREVPFTKKNGKDLTSLYVDILIATNRAHVDLIEKIQSGEYQAVSMGCLIQFSRCSQCGNIAKDDTDACKHVRFFKNNYFYDKNGVRRIIAELCGDASEPESCKFIDASWVRKPAFTGAVLRNILDITDSKDVSEKIMKSIMMPSSLPKDGEKVYRKAAALKYAEELVNEVEAAENPAATPTPPPDDSAFPAPTDQKPALGADPGAAPPADAGGAPPMDPSMAPPAGGMGGGLGDPGAAGAPPAAPVEEPLTDATVKEVKDLIKTEVLNDIRREMLEEKGKKSGVRNEEPEVATGTESNDTLVPKSARDLLGKVISASKDFRDKKLMNGVFILSNSKSWKDMRKYGYNRNDMLAILYHIDRTVSKDPVSPEFVKALSRVKLASANLKPFFVDIILETGRKPSRFEAKKLASWGKILSNFE